MRDPLIPSMRTFRPFWKLGRRQRLVVRCRILALAVGVEIVDVNDVAVGQPFEARHAFVLVEIDLGVHALQFLVALTAVVEPGQDDPSVVGRPLRDHQFMALDAAGGIDQGSGRRPVGIIQGGFVQRRQDALEEVLLAHDAFLSSRLVAARRGIHPFLQHPQAGTGVETLAQPINMPDSPSARASGRWWREIPRTPRPGPRWNTHLLRTPQSMTATLIGYARCSTDKQDLTAQRQALAELGVAPDRIYMDKGLTGTNRARPGLDQAMAAVRKGDTLVVPKLDRLARSVPDARHIADQLQAKGVKLALGSNIHDPNDPMGKMFFNILATFAEFEADLIRLRTREGMAIARAKGKLRGKQPKLSEKQQRELCRMHATGDYSIGDLAEVFAVSRPTVYRTLNRAAASTESTSPGAAEPK